MLEEFREVIWNIILNTLFLGLTLCWIEIAVKWHFINLYNIFLKCVSMLCQYAVYKLEMNSIVVIKFSLLLKNLMVTLAIN